MTIKETEPAHDDAGKTATTAEKKESKAPAERPAEPLSEEDQQLQNELFAYIDTLQGSDHDMYLSALNGLADRLRDATSSMTSVPKPLKMLKQKLPDLFVIHCNLDHDVQCQQLCAEIISVVGMTDGFQGTCITYRLLSENYDVAKWGHEYVKHLSAEMCMAGQDSAEFDNLFSEHMDELIELASVVVPYFLAHNAETDAVDLLGDFENLEILEQHVDEDNYERVCLYLKSCASYMSNDSEDLNYVCHAYDIYAKFGQLHRAMQCAIRNDRQDLVNDTFAKAKSTSTRLQLAHLLAMCGWRQWFPVEEEQELELVVQEAFQNTRLSENFRWLARELDILEAKAPKDVYKTHLTDAQYTRHFLAGTRETLSGLDKHRRKISDSITNGLVNAAFCSDSIFSDAAKASEFLTGMKDYGTFTAIATIGLVHLWDVDGCLLALDPYTYSEDEYVKGGALFGYGLSSSNVLAECDPVLAICSDCFSDKEEAVRTPVQVGAVLGLGAAYAGTGRRDIMDILVKCLNQTEDLELGVLCALCTGLVGFGSLPANQAVITDLLGWIMSRRESVQNEPLMVLAALGVAMFYYRYKHKQMLKHTFESGNLLSSRMGQNLRVLVLALCYAGSGDLLKLQEILAMGYNLNSTSTPAKASRTSRSEDTSTADVLNDSAQKEGDALTSAPPAIALGILAIGLVSLGDELSVDMAFRMLCQFLHIGHPESKKAVPLAIALLAVSNPKLNFMDTLVKFAHDSDQMVSVNSIIALGLIGAGTNNARISTMLRQLSVFHVKDSVAMMSIRIAHGLVHLGKGTMTFNPFRADRFILNPVALAGLVAVSVILLEPRTTLSKYPHHLLLGALAAHPRYLMTVSEETLAPINVSVRVGQAVDVVAQAGKPKAITGFQTHNTPVLLNYGERAELSTGDEDFVSLSPLLEGVVLLKKKTPEGGEPAKATE